MGLAETIILIASVVTSITVVSTAIVTAYKFIRKWDKWVKQKDKHDIEQYVQILRLVIMTPEMPLSERISAGDTYVNELHRNGAVKQKYNELLQRFKMEHLEEERVAHTGKTGECCLNCSVTQSCPTAWTVAPPGFSVHGILQAKRLEWVAIPFSRGYSQPRDPC